jgi:MFS family permease
MFCIPFNVDFSVVKHKAHAGKEIGYVNIMEKVGGVAGPVAGGLIATLFGGQYIFLLAIIMMILGGVSLLRGGEPVPVRQKLGFNFTLVARMKRDLLSFAGAGLELTAQVPE